ncbi:tyrosine-type recombinase/integrase [Desulfosporosinus fructosivorans]
MHFHDLRHFKAVIMMKYGVPDKVASQKLGHSQAQITREIYQHVLPDMDRQTSIVIEGVFSKRTEDTKKTEQNQTPPEKEQAQVSPMSNNPGEIKIEYRTVKKTDKPISRSETAASQAFTTKYEERCTACCQTIADTFQELLVALGQLARLDLAVKEKCSKDASQLAEYMVERLKEWPPVPTTNMRTVGTYATHERY